MSSAQSYETLPYPSAAFSQTHPTRLAATAILHGIDAPFPENSRVLEIGCSDGGNLINIAYTLPNSECIGIDYAPSHIAKAQQTVETLGLTNCHFITADIAQFSDDIGRFDYIISHGVYSWVPPSVQQSMINLFANMLTPHGIGYISYNTFPGWHCYRMIREVLEIGLPPVLDVHAKIAQARKFLENIEASAATFNPAYGSVVSSTLDSFRRSNDSYIGHEYFEDDNEPVYFHQFIEYLQKFGLDYVSEASSSGTNLHNASEELLHEISLLSNNRIEREQWLDFFIGRQFRKTLLCKTASNSPKELDNSYFQKLSISSLLVRLPDSTDKSPQFVSPNGLTIGSANLVLARALSYMSSQRPRPIPFDELFLKSAGNNPSESDITAIIALCRQCYDDTLGHLYFCMPTKEKSIGKSIAS